MIERLRRQHWLVRAPVYLALTILIFGLGAGIGALGTSVWQGSSGQPEEAGAPPPREQQAASRSPEEAVTREQEESTVRQEEAVARQEEEAAYIGRVGEIQAKSVETFLGVHQRLVRYDALSAEDVEEVQAGGDALGELLAQVEEMEPLPLRVVSRCLIRVSKRSPSPVPDPGTRAWSIRSVIGDADTSGPPTELTDEVAAG